MKILKIVACLLFFSFVWCVGYGDTPLKQKKEEQAKQRKRENRLKKVEDMITDLETKQEELSEAMSLPENASDPAKLMELSNEQASIASSLEELYEEWETLC